MKIKRFVVCKNAGKDFLTGFLAGLVCVGAIIVLMLIAYALI
jgi:hypothetical protein